MSELSRLKEWLYRQRSRVRLERERDERKHKKEEEGQPTERLSNGHCSSSRSH